MLKKFLSTIVALAMCLTLSTVMPIAQAVGEISDAEGFSSGTGKEGDPYLIKTAADMRLLADTVNGGNSCSGIYFLMANDIDLNGSDKNQWTPIGAFAENGDDHTDDFKGTAFSGSFNGGGYKITGLYIDAPEGNFLGLFGAVSNGTVKNLGVDGFVRGSGQISGVVAFNNGGHIINCYNAGTISGQTDVSGVLSYNNGGKVENCYNTGSISGLYSAAGVVGFDGKSVVIKNCYNFGDVECTDTDDDRTGYAGGVVGLANGSVIENCCNNGDVFSAGSSVGGIVGVMYGFAEARNCYNTGNISGKSKVGGVAGQICLESYVSEAYGVSEVQNCYNLGTVSGDSIIGGVAGQIGCEHGYDNASVENCYNYGEVSGSSEFGGVAGYQDSKSTTLNCYYLENTAATGIGTALNTDGMKTKEDFSAQNTFNYWEFPDIWNMNEDLGRPILQALPEGEFLGEGTKVMPYLIPDLETLEMFRDYVNAGNSVRDDYWRVIADIDMSEKYGNNINGKEVSWTPIGSSSAVNHYFKGKAFYGIFDGGGHEITGLYINTPAAEFVGLFGCVLEGTIKNLGVVGYVNGSYYVGGVVGGITAYTQRTAAVENCYSIGEVSGTEFVGGVVGISGIMFADRYDAVETVIVKNCYNKAKVSGNVWVGGVTGSAHANCGSLTVITENCCNFGEVSGITDTGGVVGGNCAIGKGISVIKGCYNTEKVSGSGSWIGGVVGNNTMSFSGIAITENCYNTGEVSGAANYVGGIAGKNSSYINGTSGTSSLYADGTAETSSSYIDEDTGICVEEGTEISSLYETTVSGVFAAVRNCYNIGIVSDKASSAGGIVGNNVYKDSDTATAFVENCYYLANTADLAIGTGNGNVNNTEGKPGASFTSGEAAYLLQRGQDSQVWGQHLTVDVYNRTEHDDEHEYAHNYPILTAVPAQKVLKVTFMYNTEAMAAEKYANPYATLKATTEGFPENAKPLVGWKTTGPDGETKIFEDGTVFIGGNDIVFYAVFEGIPGFEPPKAKDPAPVYQPNLPQVLIEPGKTETGKMVYSLSKNGEYKSTPLPTGIDAGDYTVWYKIVDEYGKDIEIEGLEQPMSVNAKIDKATPSPTIPRIQALYGQKLSDKSVMDQLPKGFKWDDATQSVGDVGTNYFTATFEIQGNSNYNIAKNIPIPVTVAYFTPPKPIMELVYNSKPQELVVPGVTAVGTMVYKVDKVGGTRTLIAEDTVGTGIAITGDGNTQTESQTPTADVAISGDGNTQTETQTPTTDVAISGDGNTQTETQVLAADVSEDQSISPLAMPPNGDYSRNIPTGTDAGTYEIYYKITDAEFANDLNYDRIAPQPLIVVIAKADPTPPEPTLNATVGQTLKDVEPQLPKGFKWDNNAQSVGNAGTNYFKATYEIEGNTNYNVLTLMLPINVTEPDKPAETTTTTTTTAPESTTTTTTAPEVTGTPAETTTTTTAPEITNDPPSTTNPSPDVTGNGNEDKAPNTGIILVVAPFVFATISVVIAKKRK